MSKYSLQITCYAKQLKEKCGELFGGATSYVRDTFESCDEIYKSIQNSGKWSISSDAKIVKHHSMTSLTFGFDVETTDNSFYHYETDNLEESYKQWKKAKRSKQTKEISDFMIYSVEKKFP